MKQRKEMTGIAWITVIALVLLFQAAGEAMAQEGAGAQVSLGRFRHDLLRGPERVIDAPVVRPGVRGDSTQRLGRLNTILTQASQAELKQPAEAMTKSQRQGKITAPETQRYDLRVGKIQ